MPIYGLISNIDNEDPYPLLYIEAINIAEAKNKLYSKAENEDDFIILYEKIVGKGSFGDFVKDEVPNSTEERLIVFSKIEYIFNLKIMDIKCFGLYMKQPNDEDIKNAYNF
jgi:hypothetical protein